MPTDDQLTTIINLAGHGLLSRQTVMAQFTATPPAAVATAAYDQERRVYVVTSPTGAVYELSEQAYHNTQFTGGIERVPFVNPRTRQLDQFNDDVARLKAEHPDLAREITQRVVQGLVNGDNVVQLTDMIESLTQRGAAADAATAAKTVTTTEEKQYVTAGKRRHLIRT